MPSIALSGQDTIIINNRIIVDLADANCGELTFPTESAAVKTGKNGNSIYSPNAAGRNAELKLRILRAGSDDKFLNQLYALQINNFAGFALLIGQYIKKIGDGTGKNIASDSYILSGGIFTKPVEAKTNADGDTEQSVSIYSFKFALAPRVIQ